MEYLNLKFQNEVTCGDFLLTDPLDRSIDDNLQPLLLDE
jgi:hypothetical protein